MTTHREAFEDERQMLEELGAGDTTMAELQGIRPELGEAILRVAEVELEADRLANARVILEGMVITNHKDPDAWALLSITHRRLQHPLAARFCAEVATRLAPGAPWVRLTRAESLLSLPEHGDEARTALTALLADAQVGTRARSLLTALGQ
jgi:predicted Zn-dependent protease